MELEVSVVKKVLRTAAGKERLILRDIAFSLAQGEICALLGPSGCGKTTLLRIISRLDSDFDGRLVMPPATKIGMVFQEPRLLPWRTVAQNLVFVGAKAGKEALELAAALHLTQHLDHFPGELSLGLARRVAIARAFAVKPELLLLDEPFVSLDLALAAKLREELLALVLKRKATVLHVTHDVDEAIAIADRIIVLSPAPGRVVADRAVETPRRALSQAHAAKLKGDILALMAGRL
ncbi:MAG: ATP-binding cassette domain-containing protein [Methylocapsa sp.]|nr:ATP-binding cassette domain-containing protein [Methylocapsa sp.]